jgi:MoaA/NifB/PqqE/SkfB family radical SAM enzyme
MPFDEEFYLHTNADVADAVLKGLFASGQEHYARFGMSEGRLPGRPAEDFLSSPTTDTVFLELTSRCNLRCVYCAVSQPTYRGIDLALDGFDNFLEQMQRRGVRTLTMNGHGESTIIKEWEVYADRLIDAGFRLHMTTNLAKRLTAAEIAALSRFERILVSIDTVDPDLLSQLRRGANLETILTNIAIVQEFAATRRRSPQIWISCTVGDLSAPGLLDLVEAFLAHGVRMFRFGDLAEYEPIAHVTWMSHVSKLPADAMVVAGERFRLALKRIEAAGGGFEIDATLTSLLLRDDAVPIEVAERETRISDKTVHYVDVDPQETRDCLDPWRIAFVQADASVRPCCFFEEKLGTLMTHSLEDVVEGEAFRQLRREIVTGELRPNCRSCSARPLIERAAFERKLASYLGDERDRSGRPGPPIARR